MTLIGRGDVLRVLVVVQLIVNMISIAALILAIIGLSDITRAETVSRRGSAVDSCHLLRGLVFHATAGNPTGRRESARFIAGTPLHNCTVYARALVK